MKLKVTFSIEVRRQPACARPHADEAEEVTSVTGSHVERAACWDMDQRSPVTAARIGFSQPPSGAGRPGHE